MADSLSSFWSQLHPTSSDKALFPMCSFVFCNGAFFKIIWVNLLNILLLWLDSGFCEMMVQIHLHCSVPNRVTGTSVVLLSREWLFSTLWTAAHQASLFFTVSQTYVHWVGDVIQPSYPLLPPSPPAFNLSQHRGLFQWVISLHQVANVLELQLQYQSFQWIFRVDFL